jgi:PAS domain S-box-containing protein
VDKEHKAELKNANLNQKIAIRERRLDSILQAQSTYLVRTDLEGIIRFANQTFSRKDGVDPATLIGRSIGSEVFADDREKLKVLLNQCLQHPGKICADLIRFQWNGTTRFVEWEFKGIQDDEGTIREFPWVGIDLTERMDYLKEISEYKQRMDNILSSVNEIVWSSDAETYE